MSGIAERLREVCSVALPLPGAGKTPERHLQLFAIARESVSLAKLAEAHFDALAILAEAGREAEPDAVYAVWASEVPGRELALATHGNSACVSGEKPFCSGGRIVDRALVTVGRPEPLLVEVDLRAHAACIHFDLSRWQVESFRATETGAATLQEMPVAAVVGPRDFYLSRPGFWNGACGPAACWAGGAAGLLPFAERSSRNDAHTVAHRAAMQSNVWAMQALLVQTGREIDGAPHDRLAAQVRALRLRHQIETLATDTLRRFARAYGPHPLAMDAAMGLRYTELDIFLRQSHGERDLESLGRLPLAAAD